MKLSTKGRYAVIAMIDLALNDREAPVTLSDISESQGISLSYLEQLFSKLRKKKLVEGVRGPGGGYRLARMPNKISIAEIVTAVDESVDVTHCKGESNCKKGERCLTHQLWEDLSNQLYSFLDGIKLDQFVSHSEISEIASKQDKETKMKNFVFPAPVLV